MNDIVDYLHQHQVALGIVVAFCALVGLCVIARLWRFLYVLVSIAVLAVGGFASLQLTSIPIHAFDHSWDVQHEIPLDANIMRMAKRAQFDSYICGLPIIGRGPLRLESAARHGSDYDLFFIPNWTDTLVVYRFGVNRKPLWKTCTWVKI